MPLTRQLFLDYHARARRTAPAPRPTAAQIKREGERAWNDMTVPQRNEFVRLITRISEVKARRDAALQVANNAAADALTEVAANPVSGHQLVRTAEAAAEQHRQLVVVQQGVITAFNNLNNFVAATIQRAAVQAAVQALILAELNVEALALGTAQAAVIQWQTGADFPPVPPRPVDGVLKMLESSLSVNRRAMRKADRRTVFRLFNYTQMPPFSQNPGVGIWHGAWMMGEGGMSNTGVYVHLDNAQQVDQRTMRKDTRMVAEQWASAECFDGNVRDRFNRMPMEITCHSAMQGVMGRSTTLYPGTVPTPTVPIMHSSAVSDDEFTYIMYLEYCPFGDLASIIREYRRNNDAIPEPFIWYVFLSLAEAGLAMERGNQNLLPAAPGWPPDLVWGHTSPEIVHRDLKPSNVFLGSPLTNHFEDYPSPKASELGDFGIAIKTSAADGWNPNIYFDSAGTRGFLAPEMRRYIDRLTLQPIDRWQLLSHTNVWGIGMIIYCMITLQNRIPQKEWLGDPNQDILNAQANARMAYSNDLYQLVRQCLMPDPALRPPFQLLLPDIENCINTLNLAQGMRDQSADPVDWPFLTLWHQPSDAYAIGLAGNQLPPG